MQNCPNTDQLQLLLADELDDRQRAPLEMHLEKCSACQESLEQLTRDTYLWKYAGVHTGVDE
ncbi:MAG: zf-HC2 domain-containing protein, partial [Planctomycetes bacterium]|nr:zf-HC2 domain-containing protein [Planctomycetota bacterium]